MESASLPVLQLLAVAVNFPVVAISSQPLFTFPLRSLDDVLADTPFPGIMKKTKTSTRATKTNSRSKSKSSSKSPDSSGMGEVAT